MGKKAIIAACAVALVAGGGVAAADALLGGSEWTTTLDQYTTVDVDGEAYLDGGIVAQEVLSIYHPLPWIGDDVDGVTCDGHLRSAIGATLKCHGTADGERVEIPVTVDSAGSGYLAWSFQR